MTETLEIKEMKQGEMLIIKTSKFTQHYVHGSSELTIRVETKKHTGQFSEEIYANIYVNDVYICCYEDIIEYKWR